VQVRENTASTARQYQLVERAQTLGWPAERITVIDQDQGHSGASARGRAGFERLMTEVGLGRAGAIFSLEASRLARSCSDWYRLLEICALSDTLVIDEDGIYDPGQYDDRLLLGFRGTMSEAELHWLRSRLLGGKRATAERGQLCFRLPVGFVYDEEGRIVLDPDEEIRQAVRQIFTLFDQQGSALAVVKHFAAHRLDFPTRSQRRGEAAAVYWQPLSLKRTLAVLHSPLYAGTYVYGRTRTHLRPQSGAAPGCQGHTHRVPLADWPIVRHDHHPGYIDWEQFLRNQQQLDDNRTVQDAVRRGAVREGTALLQGIVRCGRCGRRMSIRYLKGDAPCYTCNHLHQHWGGPTCQSIPGAAVDQRVAAALLEALTPVQFDIALAAFETLETQAQHIDQQWQRRLERAHYEATLAQRRYRAVDPDHRLVARNLEQDWNARLAAVEQLEREYAALPARAIPPLSDRERARIRALADDLPALWQAPTTPWGQRKQVLRLLIKDVTLTREPDRIRIEIRWQTHACTTLTAPRPQPSYEQWRTAPAVIARIREQAARQTDAEMAAALNAQGWKPGHSDTFTARKVRWIRRAYGITSSCPLKTDACPTGQRGDGRYSTQAAAQLLNVHVSTLSKWCRSGRLPSVQAAPRSPRWITLAPEVITRLRRPPPGDDIIPPTSHPEPSEPARPSPQAQQQT
jgi:DNA invertase Pin-like site-specific DNA recombinase